MKVPVPVPAPAPVPACNIKPVLADVGVSLDGYDERERIDHLLLTQTSHRRLFVR